MIGKWKEFDEELLKRYDEPARAKIKSVLGDAVIDNPNIKGADLIITHPNVRFKYLELQICAGWFDTFPYEKVYVFARKMATHDSSTLFLTMNRGMEKGYLFSINEKNFKLLKKRRLKKWSREFVYEIPWHLCIPCDIDDLDAFTLEML